MSHGRPCTTMELARIYKFQVSNVPQFYDILVYYNNTVRSSILYFHEANLFQSNKYTVKITAALFIADFEFY